MEETEYFSGYAPNFTLTKPQITLEQFVNSQKHESIIEKYVEPFYKNYILKYKFIFFFLLFIFIILMYRCFFDIELETMGRATFNPYYPINKQINYSQISVPQPNVKPILKTNTKSGQIFKNAYPNYGGKQQNAVMHQRYNNDYKNPFMDFADQKSLENLSTYFTS